MKSLQTKILAFFSTLIIVAGCILGYILYFASANLITTSIGTQAKSLAEMTAKRIDIEQFSKVLAQVKENPADDQNRQRVLAMPEYVSIREMMAQLREANGLKYLYTMAEINGSYAYIIDGFPLNETEEASLPGDVEEEEYESLTQTFATGQATLGELDYSEEYGATITAYVPLVNAQGEMVGIVGADFNATDIYSMLEKNRLQMLEVTAIVLLVTVAVSYLFSRLLVGPLKRLTASVEKVRQGDLTIKVESTGKDEIGQLSRAFAGMVADLNQIIKGIDENSLRLTEASRELAAGTEATSAGTQQTVDKVKLLQNGAEHQRTVVEHASETVKQMIGEIQGIASRSDQVFQVSQSVTRLADTGRKQAEDVVDRIQQIQMTQSQSAESIGRLDQLSRDIDKIVEAITDLSKQTHMLALNASIEASRAGEAGRGFAVVADEVQKLASGSAQAASHISRLIGEVQQHTRLAVERIEKATGQIDSGANNVISLGNSFHLINEAVHDFTGQMEGVSKAASELSSASSKIVEVVHTVEKIAKENTRAAEEFGALTEEQQASMQEIQAASDELSRMAERLYELIRNFRV